MLALKSANETFLALQIDCTQVGALPRPVQNFLPSSLTYFGFTEDLLSSLDLLALARDLPSFGDFESCAKTFRRLFVVLFFVSLILTSLSESECFFENSANLAGSFFDIAPTFQFFFCGGG